MTKKFNADEAYEDLEVIVDGKVYPVPAVSSEKLALMQEKFPSPTNQEEAEAEAEKDPYLAAKQLAFILDVSDETVFYKTSVVKLKGVLEFIMENLKGTEEESGKG